MTRNEFDNCVNNLIGVGVRVDSSKKSECSQYIVKNDHIFDDLFDILEIVAREMNVVQYRKLISSDIIKLRTDMIYDFYNTDKQDSVKTVYLNDLYDFLVNNVW